MRPTGDLDSEPRLLHRPFEVPDEGEEDGLRAEGINVEEMDNIIFDGAEAACCTLLLDQSPSTNLMQQLREQPEVLSALLEANE